MDMSIILPNKKLVPANMLLKLKSPAMSLGASTDHPCNVCGKIYRSKGGLYNHKRYDCGKAPQFKCPLCPYRSKYKGDLKSHFFGDDRTPKLSTNARFYEIEIGEAMMKCSDCPKTYKTKAGLHNHKKYECGKPPQFKCPHCPHETKQKGNLKAHLFHVHNVATI
ncbi:hypothetical protein GE061_020262 [Apolygus lucorum]|uniref:C2H2-type domain-containing protein n=1 Tax=Apolygus lucorum TaxID=248454 RepID=A0A8S9WM36_APOLU|nr:hypothetical protein GE061_020262 [Apolygus lucorum]